MVLEFTGENKKEKKRKVEDLQESTGEMALESIDGKNGKKGNVLELEFTEDKKKGKKMKVDELTGEIGLEKGIEKKKKDEQWAQTLLDLIDAFNRLEIKETQYPEIEGLEKERHEDTMDCNDDDEHICLVVGDTCECLLHEDECTSSDDDDDGDASERRSRVVFVIPVSVVRPLRSHFEAMVEENERPQAGFQFSNFGR
ncbi:hypothetical protein E2C01_007685 [Portunus trituberculatus]|uniref:Uncharacterized protein n=1 Tax=Portunus trituberculatus TaxID=210409 RepID=A0A5B7CYS3_PORTR|nr:hypothetical protein [Portunus trituberculatus]